MTPPKPEDPLSLQAEYFHDAASPRSVDQVPESALRTLSTKRGSVNDRRQAVSAQSKEGQDGDDDDDDTDDDEDVRHY